MNKTFPCERTNIIVIHDNSIKSSHSYQPMHSGIQNGHHEESVCTDKSLILQMLKRVVLEANKLEQRSGPTYVGPDLGSSLFATIQNTDRSVSKLKWVQFQSAFFSICKHLLYFVSIQTFAKIKSERQTIWISDEAPWFVASSGPKTACKGLPNFPLGVIRIQMSGS